MKSHSIAAGLALAVLAIVAFVGPVTADDRVPFRGNFVGSAEVSAFPSVVVTATGNASQVGQFTFTMPHIVNPPTSTAAGTFKFVAANGDTLFGTQTGVATPTEAANVLFIIELATITGGTGRFAGASGGFRIERLYDRVSGATSGSLNGTLSASGDRK